MTAPIVEALCEAPQVTEARDLLGKTLNDDFGFWSSSSNERYRNPIYSAYKLLGKALASARAGEGAVVTEEMAVLALDTFYKDRMFRSDAGKWLPGIKSEMRLALEAALSARPARMPTREDISKAVCCPYPEGCLRSDDCIADKSGRDRRIVSAVLALIAGKQT